MRRMEHVADALQSFLQGANLYKPLQRWRVVLCWSRLVGSEIAAHADAIELRAGVLWVAVPSSSWRQHILFLKPRILESLSREFPEVSISDIRFVSRPR
ncbi:MAG: DUF721 domain-containing protein [Candidatus Eisenbacteria sp.]|nr:DUF721 domain-containing protein [Candidatus Eisenbacteria bacterium]